MQVVSRENLKAKKENTANVTDFPKIASPLQHKLVLLTRHVSRGGPDTPRSVRFLPSFTSTGVHIYTSNLEAHFKEIARRDLGLTLPGDIVENWE